jgi:hypothetical protein
LPTYQRTNLWKLSPKKILIPRNWKCSL